MISQFSKSRCAGVSGDYQADVCVWETAFLLLPLSNDVK